MRYWSLMRMLCQPAPTCFSARFCRVEVMSRVTSHDAMPVLYRLRFTHMGMRNHQGPVDPSQFRAQTDRQILRSIWRRLEKRDDRIFRHAAEGVSDIESVRMWANRYEQPRSVTLVGTC